MSNRNAIRKYTIETLQYEPANPFAAIVHAQLQANATLRLDPVHNGCYASLHFLYHWYAAELILGFPVDGDGASAFSNGKLETAYLQALQDQLGAATSHQNVSIH